MFLQGRSPSDKQFVDHLVLHTLVFGILSGLVFLLLTFGFFQLYGHEFLNESLLHHLTRKDPRHNFSIYFYHIYLKLTGPAAAVAGPAGLAGATGAVLGGAVQSKEQVPAMTIFGAALGDVDPDKVLAWAGDPANWAFMPQLAVLGVLAWRFHRQLPLCWMLQTMAFVALNKVSSGCCLLLYTVYQYQCITYQGLSSAREMRLSYAASHFDIMFRWATNHQSCLAYIQHLSTGVVLLCVGMGHGFTQCR